MSQYDHDFTSAFCAALDGHNIAQSRWMGNPPALNHPFGQNDLQTTIAISRNVAKLRRAPIDCRAYPAGGIVLLGQCVPCSKANQHADIGLEPLL